MTGSTFNIDKEFADVTELEAIKVIKSRNWQWSIEPLLYEKNRDKQYKGIDFVIETEGRTPRNIDVKAIAGNLPTFSFEVYCMNMKGYESIGWFNKDNTKIETDNYVLLSAIPEGGSCSYKEGKEKIVNGDIKEMEVMFVNKHKLMKVIDEFYRNHGANQKDVLDKVIKQVREKGCPKETIKFDPYTGAIVNRSLPDFYYVYSGLVSEKPINLVVRKDFMMETEACKVKLVYDKEGLQKIEDEMSIVNKEHKFVFTKKEEQMFNENYENLHKDLSKFMDEMQNEYNKLVDDSGLEGWQFDYLNPGLNPSKFSEEKVAQLIFDFYEGKKEMCKDFECVMARYDEMIARLNETIDLTKQLAEESRDIEIDEEIEEDIEVSR